MAGCQEMLLPKLGSAESYRFPMIGIGEVSSLESSCRHQLMELADNVEQGSLRSGVKEQLGWYLRSNSWRQSLQEEALSRCRHCGPA